MNKKNNVFSIYWNEITSHSILMREYIKINAKTMIEYKWSFIIQVVTMFLNDLVFIFYWYLFFLRFPKINGWEFNDLLLLWSIATICYGLVGVFFANRTAIPSIIYGGKLDYYLALPKNALFHLLISKSSAFALGDVIFGIFIALIALTPNKAPLFVLFIITGSIIMLSFAILTGILTFWMGNSEKLSTSLWNGTISMTSYPTSIFDNTTRLILFTILPAGLIGGLPIEVIKNFNLESTILIIVMSIIIFLAAIFFFYLGLRRYESGNNLYVNN